MERRLLGCASRGKPAEAEACGGNRGVPRRERGKETDSVVKSDARGQISQQA